MHAQMTAYDSLFFYPLKGLPGDHHDYPLFSILKLLFVKNIYCHGVVLSDLCNSKSKSQNKIVVNFFS